MNALNCFLSNADLLFTPNLSICHPIVLDFITTSTLQKSRDVGDVQMFVWFLKKKKKDSLYEPKKKPNRRTRAQLTISVCVGFCCDEPRCWVFFSSLSKNKFLFSFVLLLYAGHIIISFVLGDILVWANEWCFRILPLLCNVKDPKLSFSLFL